MTTQGRESRWLDLKLLPDQATSDHLDRILEAIQEYIPANLDKDRLLADLKDAVWLYVAGIMMRKRPAKQRQRGDRIIETVRDLKALLDDGQNPPVTFEPPGVYWEQLDFLIADIEKCRMIASRYGSRLGLGERSAFEHLILRLREMFKTCFGIEHRYTKRPESDEVEGPFIDFAAAVLTEFGINNSGKPYSRRAIADALTNRDRSTGKTARK